MKISKQNGFTLVEMLVVVAVTAVLAAVSIPLVSGALNKARHAADAANERAAKAAMSATCLTKDMAKEAADGGFTQKPDETGTSVLYVYDAANGKLVLVPIGAWDSVKETIEPYAKCRNDGHDDCYLFVRFNTSSYLTEMLWFNKRPNQTISGWNEGLCSQELISGD